MLFITLAKAPGKGGLLITCQKNVILGFSSTSTIDSGVVQMRSQVISLSIYIIGHLPARQKMHFITLMHQLHIFASLTAFICYSIGFTLN